MKKEKRKGNYYQLSQEDFISRCKQNQRVEINYDWLIYTSMKEKYEVTCLRHNHTYLQGGQALSEGAIGCKFCMGEYKSLANTGNLTTFLEKFNERFPDHKFDFSKSVYIKANTCMNVLCQKGHLFSIKPNNLLSGHGCPRCVNLDWGHEAERTVDSYKQKFIKAHGELYDYSLVSEIKGSKHKINVGCNKHGLFKITPDNHIQGKGCPLCGNSGFQPQKPATFYILRITDHIIKFGITSDINRRLPELQRTCKYTISVLERFDFDSGYVAQEIENNIYADKSIVRSVVDKKDMLVGYVETTYSSNLDKILKLVHKNIL